MFNTLHKTVLGAAAALVMASGAHASTVNISGTVSTTGGVNNFADELAAALGTAVLLAPASLTTNGPVMLTFTAVAAESGFANSFTAIGAGSLSENSFFGEGVDLLTTAGIGSVNGVYNGLLDALLSFSNNEIPALVVSPGSTEFGVFVKDGVGDHSVFFLAFDDNGAGPDDNHDDLLIRVNVSAVPLPAGGLLLIGGLGALALMRRRKSAA